MSDAEVCVVGAGYAGLAAARTLVQAGKSVVVIEARDRVGGRVLTADGPGGAPLDMGGTWVAPGHHALLGLANEMGVGTYKTYTAGATVLAVDGEVQRYRGAFPKLNPLVLGSLGLGMARLDRMAKSLPVDNPWTARKAVQWDTQSAAKWIADHVKTKRAREILASVVRGLFTCDPAEVSLLHVLYLIRSAGDLNTLLAIEGGYQDARFSGGAQRIANLMAQELGSSLCTESPARRIVQNGDEVVVIGDDVTVRAKHAVLAVPPVLGARIDFSPELPLDRKLAMQRMPSGFVLKMLAVYDEPFWRADGLSGQSIDFDTPFEISLDISPESGKPGMLGFFAFGPRAMALGLAGPEARRAELIHAVTTRFGAAARNPIAIEEHEWANEEWSRGGMMAHFPPGVLTQFGPLLRRPEGRIHWAGTETATISHGTIDGAVRSGQRAATEVLAAS